MYLIIIAFIIIFAFLVYKYRKNLWVDKTYNIDNISVEKAIHIKNQLRPLMKRWGIIRIIENKKEHTDRSIIQRWLNSIIENDDEILKLLV